MRPGSFATGASAGASSAPARCSRPRFRLTGTKVLWPVATVLLAFATGDVIARTTGISSPRFVINENAVDLHLRASQRALDDAHRCAGELRVLAVRHPGITVRVLEIDPALIAQSRARPGGLPALAVETIDASVVTVEAASRGIAHLQASLGANASFTDLGDLSGRAHRISDHLCEAREVVSAATLTPPPLRRAQLTARPGSP